VVDLGYNYRIDEIRSALGKAQLRKLEKNNEHRRALTERYWRELDGLGLGLAFREATGKPSFHILPILLPEGAHRIGFIDRMRAEGIQTSIHYPAIHQFSYYRERFPGISLPMTELAAGREVTLPLYPTMGEERVEAVVAAVQRALMESSRGANHKE
jgi:dTDP-4-amino-4,6-dideoxygalactose transaminase